MGDKRVIGSLHALRSSRAVRLAFGVGLSILCIYLAVHNIAYANVVHALLEADVRFVILALLSVTLNTCGKALRW